MKSVINRLYSGELFPAEQIVPTGEEYKKLTDRISSECRYLKEKMSDEDIKRLDLLDKMYSEECFMENKAGFVYGFKLGVQLMCETLMKDKKDKL